MSEKIESEGLLERLGVKYYRSLFKKANINEIASFDIDDLPPDETLQALVENITLFAAIIAFTIGVLTTIVSVWFELEYKDQLETVTYYLLYISVVITMLVIELSVLYWLGLKTVYSISCLTGHHRTIDGSLPGDDSIANILSRAALEIPDPVVDYLGIDPLKHISKSKLLFVGLLYKAKVVFSGLVVKFILVRMFGKGGLRFDMVWVSVPVTGIWDAFTIYKVAREARLRLFGNRLAQYMVDSIMQPEIIDNLSPKTREGAIRAVANMMVLTQNYHPNMLVLLVKLSDTFEVKQGCDYDDWDEFLQLLEEVPDKERYFLLDLLCIAAAFDGQLSRLERYHLPQAFKEYTDVYMLRIEKLTHCLLTGQLHSAKLLCQLDFEPG